ncbi:unnamed protein product [Calypogeia fissa]
MFASLGTDEILRGMGNSFEGLNVCDDCLGTEEILRRMVNSFKGFLSIDCGATIAYDDPDAKLYWETNAKYISTGVSGQVPVSVNSTWENYEALQTFRYFPHLRSKHCYELPTTGNTSYFDRAMFVHGTASELTLPISFNAAVNGTELFSVNYNADSTTEQLTTPLDWEGILFSPGTLTHFCLVSQTGVPFISSLEIREFDSTGIMYSFQGSTARDGAPKAMAPKLVPLLYPDDRFYRLWKTPGEWASALGGVSGSVERLEFSHEQRAPESDARRLAE